MSFYKEYKSRYAINDLTNKEAIVGALKVLILVSVIIGFVALVVLNPLVFIALALLALVLK